MAVAEAEDLEYGIKRKANYLLMYEIHRMDSYRDLEGILEELTSANTFQNRVRLIQILNRIKEILYTYILKNNQINTENADGNPLDMLAADDVLEYGRRILALKNMLEKFINLAFAPAIRGGGRRRRRVRLSRRSKGTARYRKNRTRK